MSKKEINGIVATAKSAGIPVARTKKGHWRFTCPDGKQIFTGSTPSCYRAPANVRAELKRHGVNLWTHTKKEEAKPVGNIQASTRSRKIRKWNELYLLASKEGLANIDIAKLIDSDPESVRRYVEGANVGCREAKLDRTLSELRARAAAQGSVPAGARSDKPTKVNVSDAEVSGGMIEVLGTIKIDLQDVLRTIPDDVFAQEALRRMAAK